MQPATQPGDARPLLDAAGAPLPAELQQQVPVVAPLLVIPPTPSREVCRAPPESRRKTLIPARRPLQAVPEQRALQAPEQRVPRDPEQPAQLAPEQHAPLPEQRVPLPEQRDLLPEQSVSSESRSAGVSGPSRQTSGHDESSRRVSSMSGAIKFAARSGACHGSDVPWISESRTQETGRCKVGNLSCRSSASER